MPLKKLQFKPGVNRENTRYTNEGGYYECDKIRFRQGTPEKIGGWEPVSTNTFLGICRSLWNWITLGGLNLTGVGTSDKFYVEQGGQYNDITPLSVSHTLTNAITTVSGSPIITITDAAGGFSDGNYVTVYALAAVGGLTVRGNYEILSSPTPTTYTINVGTNASSSATGGGTVYVYYEIASGADSVVPQYGWGASTWGSGAWGVGQPSPKVLRIWNQQNFGENLIYGPRGGPAYYWYAAVGYSGVQATITIATPAVVSVNINLVEGQIIQFQTTGTLPTGISAGTSYYVKNVSGNTCNLTATYGGSLINTTGTQTGTHSISPRGVPLASIGGAASVPTAQNNILISDASRFVLFFGTTDVNSTTLDTMLIRWSDQENPVDWAPTSTNQAGSLRLSHGSEIITALQSRQEILVWTDSSLYSLQYLGPPVVWGSQLLADNVSIMSENVTALGSGVVYWMGRDKFYKYDGRTQTMRCDLRNYIFSDINVTQAEQFFASTVESFNEVWWFYCSASSLTIDRYVVYNYLEDIWYYGTMNRTAWMDSHLKDNPISAGYTNKLINQEVGLNDNTDGVPSAINAYIVTSEFDIDDGQNFAFIWRILPDLTFRGSTANSPSATMYLYPLQNSGSGYNDPASVAGTNYAAITRTAVIPIEKFTGQILTRVRGRQLAFKISSNQLDTTWQLGSPRIDLKPDGRR